MSILSTKATVNILGLNGFAVKLTALVKAGSHRGYLCDVKRKHDKEYTWGYNLITSTFGNQVVLLSTIEGSL